MGKYSVYKHTSPNGKVYIGITGRKPEHRWNNGKGYYQNQHFQNAINMYGWDNFTHEIIVDGLTKEEACEIEKELISKYKSNQREYGYNKSSGGENPAEGIHVSEETRRKQSLSHKNYVASDEAKRKISEAKRGKSNGREGYTGIKSGTAKIVLQINEKTNEVIRIFYGYYEIERETGFKRTPVMEAAHGIRKRAYGYKWVQKERGEVNVLI